VIIKVYVQDKKIKADIQVFAEILRGLSKLAGTYTTKDGYYHLKLSLFDEKPIEENTSRAHQALKNYQTKIIKNRIQQKLKST